MTGDLANDDAFSHYTSRAPRVQVSETKAALARSGSSRRLRLAHRPSESVDAILDLSLSGMKIQTYAFAPEPEDLLDVELRHRELRGPVKLTGRVKWVREEHDNEYTVGIHFEQVRDTTRVALERFISLELGSTIVNDSGKVGFLADGPRAPLGEQRLVIYDPLRGEVAEVLVGTGACLLRLRDQPDASPETFETLEAALERVFPGRGRVRIVAPVVGALPPAEPQDKS